jgi:hypothetical protein
MKYMDELAVVTHFSSKLLLSILGWLVGDMILAHATYLSPDFFLCALVADSSFLESHSYQVFGFPSL